MTKSFSKSGIIFLFAIISIVTSVHAQTLMADTISKSTADLRRTNSTVVNFDASRLNSILASCVSKGVSTVQFLFATIREQDTTRYFSKHSNVAKEDRRSIIGKATLLLRVPRRAFNLSFNEDPLKNRVIKQMMGAGFILLDAPYGGSPSGISGDLYFDIGTVCPPPSNCDETVL